MTAPELAESPAAGRGGRATLSGGRLATGTWHPALIVTALTVIGVVLRAIVAGQSIFADELSTYWISATHGLGGVLSLLYGTGRITHAEITPPLYFVLAWLTTRLGHSPELLRLPSLLAGTATIPIVYLLGLRTVGRRAALVAAAVTTLAPFAIYYSADARAYGVMMLAILISTVAMLRALDTGQARWWGLYAVSACAAFYAHYTCAFVLSAQLLWVLWAHPEARRAALVASTAAAAGVLPWLPGLINDYRSPTVKILNALSPFTFSDIRIDLAHWVIGYPETFAGGLTRLPGKPALILFAAAVLIGAFGLIKAVRGAPLGERLAGIDRRVVLVVGLALATPVAELVLGVAGDSLFSVRDLGASWPYLALTGGAVLALSGSRAVILGAVLALVAFALGAVKMLGGDFQRPDYQGAASYVTQNARPGDIVVDETGALSPGPLTGLDVALHRRLPIVRAQAPAERDHPFGFSDPIVALQRAVTMAVADAHGHRVFLVTNAFVTDIASLAGRVNPAPSQFPADYRLSAERIYPGLGATLVAVYSNVGAQAR